MCLPLLHVEMPIFQLQRNGEGPLAHPALRNRHRCSSGHRAPRRGLRGPCRTPRTSTWTGDRCSATSRRSCPTCAQLDDLIRALGRQALAPICRRAQRRRPDRCCTLSRGAGAGWLGVCGCPPIPRPAAPLPSRPGQKPARAQLAL